MSAGNEREFIAFLQNKGKGGEAMKCPLFTTNSKPEHLRDHPEYSDCLQEQCAWWFKNNGVCAVLTLAQGLVYLHKVLLSMENKMPHKVQFRK